MIPLSQSSHPRVSNPSSLNSLNSLPLLLFLLFPLFPVACIAQFAPTQPDNLTEIFSPIDPQIKISYKVPKGACKTVFEDQQQYTGWVSVPGSSPTNLFFWFVAARDPTSVLTTWLNGGPGSSSMFGLFAELGPCEVVEKSADRLDTAAREWGWDRASNMLFIDQPNQVGFSYDVPTNGSLDLVQGDASTPPMDLPDDHTPTTFLNGTFGSLNTTGTANTTQVAAMAIWHMLQGFLSAFPEYNPPNNDSLGVNLFAESYGGKYGPVFAKTWEEQNARRANGTLSPSTLDIHLTSLGIINGCVDDLIQGPFYASMAVNNTYGLEATSSLRANLAKASFYQPGGCKDIILRCRAAAASFDPENAGNVDSVNRICSKATSQCNDQLMSPYADAGRSLYDIAHKSPESFPPSYYIEYLNSRPVQDAIGSVVNFTDSSRAVSDAFQATGDWERGPIIPDIASLLNSGVRVGFMYGDRDFICNWLGGEAVSLAVASEAGGSYASSFPTAGYAPVIVNDSYIGGVVRQFGNLSFSRIYQAGHFIPAYQPETAFQVFARIIMGTSVSTGKPVSLDAFNTTGPLNATSTQKLPSSPTATCYLRALSRSCGDDDIESILAGKGVVINGVWYPSSKDWPGATSTTSSGSASSTASGTTAYTGLFTATSTPDSPGVRASNPPGPLALLVFVAIIATGAWRTLLPL